MSDLLQVPAPSEWNPSEITMAAAEAVASELFEIADNDSSYHRKVDEIKKLLLHDKNLCSCDEVAECILAWWGEL